MKYRCTLFLFMVCITYGGSAHTLNDPEVGYWFYKDNSINHRNAENNEKCRDPLQWDASCGFIDPSSLQLHQKAAFQFEQKQYRTFIEDFSLHPNALRSVVNWQKFNHWVIEQSMASAYSAQYIRAQSPHLDSTVYRPFSYFGNILYLHSEEEKRRSFFSLLSKHSFLVFFSRSNCPYCHAESSVVRLLSRKTKIPIWNVSLDQDALPGFSGFMKGPDTLAPARLLQVNVVPTLFLYMKDQKRGQWIRLATGLVDEESIENRIIHFLLKVSHHLYHNRDI